MESTTPWRGPLRRPRQGVVDGLEMSDVAADVAAVAAFLAAQTQQMSWLLIQQMSSLQPRLPPAVLVQQ